MSSGRFIYKLHKWCGLIAGIVILILGISGSILVFHEELERFEFRHLLTVDNTERVHVDRAYYQVSEAYPKREIRLQRFSDNPRDVLIFSIRHSSGNLTVFAHPSSGNILNVIASQTTVTTWLLTLHYSLHSGLGGEMIMLIAGIAFLISLITGLIVYRKALMDIFLFRTRFKKNNKRSWVSSLHRYIGVWALLLNLVIVISGVLISYDIVTNGIKVSQAAPLTITSPKISFSIDSALKVLKIREVKFQPSYIRFPLTEGKPLRISGKVEGQPFYWSKYYNYVSIDPESGEISPLTLNPKTPNTAKLASVVRAIHFVEFGNIPIKILFCLTGLSAPVLSISGFLLWRWKRRKKKPNN